MVQSKRKTNTLAYDLMPYNIEEMEQKKKVREIFSILNKEKVIIKIISLIL